MVFQKRTVKYRFASTKCNLRWHALCVHVTLFYPKVIMLKNSPRPLSCVCERKPTSSFAGAMGDSMYCSINTIRTIQTRKISLIVLLSRKN